MRAHPSEHAYTKSNDARDCCGREADDCGRTQQAPRKAISAPARGAGGRAGQSLAASPSAPARPHLQARGRVRGRGFGRRPARARARNAARGGARAGGHAGRARRLPGARFRARPPHRRPHRGIQLPGQRLAAAQRAPAKGALERRTPDRSALRRAPGACLLERARKDEEEEAAQAGSARQPGARAACVCGDAALLLRAGFGALCGRTVLIPVALLPSARRDGQHGQRQEPGGHVQGRNPRTAHRASQLPRHEQLGRARRDVHEHATRVRRSGSSSDGSRRAEVLRRQRLDWNRAGPHLRAHAQRRRARLRRRRDGLRDGRLVV